MSSSAPCAAFQPAMAEAYSQRLNSQTSEGVSPITTPLPMIAAKRSRPSGRGLAPPALLPVQFWGVIFRPGNGMLEDAQCRLYRLPVRLVPHKLIRQASRPFAGKSRCLSSRRERLRRSISWWRSAPGCDRRCASASTEQPVNLLMLSHAVAKAMGDAVNLKLNRSVTAHGLTGTECAIALQVNGESTLWPAILTPMVSEARWARPSIASNPASAGHSISTRTPREPVEV